MIFLMMSLSSFSQTDTTNTYPKVEQRDTTTVVVFTLDQTYEIARDAEKAMRFDIIKTENIILDSIVTEQAKIIELQKDEIHSYQAEINFLSSINEEQQFQNNELLLYSESLEKRYKKTKRRGFWTTTGAVIVIGTLGTLLIVK